MQVMAILRENRDSLVATLEAFVHDPLISWRLLNTKKYVTDRVRINTAIPAHLLLLLYFSMRRPKVAPIPPPDVPPAPILAPAPNPATLGSPRANTANAGAATNNTAAAETGAAGTTADNQQNCYSTGSAEGRATSPVNTTATEGPGPAPSLPARSRGRSSSKGQVGTLEPIQERRRGSNNAAQLESAAAQAMAGSAAGPITTVAEDDEEESDEEDATDSSRLAATSSPTPGKASGSSTGAGVEAAGTAQGEDGEGAAGAFVAETAVRPSTSVAEVQSALSTLDFSGAAAAPSSVEESPGTNEALPSAFRQVAGSVKSVSFASTHQTLNSDNTIRNTSARMEIVPPSGTASTDVPYRAAAAAGPLGTVTDMEVVDQYDAAARNINSRAATGPGTTAAAPAETAAPTGLAQSAGSAFAMPASSLRPNLHEEMANLANSIAMPQSPSGSGEGNNSFAHSLSQSRMSVRGSYSSAAQGASKVEALVASVADAIAAQEGGGATATGGDLDLQQELIEKAVVVIRRVMDKLTGLDFADSTGQAHALDVPDQVDRLIREATSNENLSQSFFGWCPFW
jgi:hypothetical protein